MDRKPFPRSGVLEKGVLYWFRAPREPVREPDPEVLEIVRRAHERQIREYLEKKQKRAP